MSTSILRPIRISSKCSEGRCAIAQEDLSLEQSASYWIKFLPQANEENEAASERELLWKTYRNDSTFHSPGTKLVFDHLCSHAGLETCNFMDSTRNTNYALDSVTVQTMIYPQGGLPGWLPAILALVTGIVQT